MLGVVKTHRLVVVLLLVIIEVVVVLLVVMIQNNQNRRTAFVTIILNMHIYDQITAKHKPLTALKGNKLKADGGQPNQHVPTEDNRGQRAPMGANWCQQGPTEANGSQQGPTGANEGQRKTTGATGFRAHTTGDNGGQRPKPQDFGTLQSTLGAHENPIPLSLLED
jgi:low affinity Fe/Cu permease